MVTETVPALLAVPGTVAAAAVPALLTVPGAGAAAIVVFLLTPIGRRAATVAVLTRHPTVKAVAVRLRGRRVRVYPGGDRFEIGQRRDGDFQ